MLLIRRILLSSLLVFALLYAGVCIYIYNFQEKLIFHPEILAANYKFDFGINTSEINFKMDDQVNLNAILCADTIETEKVILFLHGNSGNLSNLENTAKFYTSMGYDFLSYDYREFGKSEGNIKNETQFFKDAKAVYQELKKEYSEDSIVIVGYSLGTCTAAWLASEVNCKQLVLIAPYYSIAKEAKEQYFYLPTSYLLKYPFETYKYLPKVNESILLTHGTNDQVMSLENSKQLSKLLKKKDKFLPIKGLGHDGFEENNLFQLEIKQFLQTSN